MPINIVTSRQFKQFLNPNSPEGLLAKTRKEFSKRGPVKVKQAIVQDMTKGISPVKGKGKWKRYSQSYKDVIRNKAAYRIIKGKVVRFGKVFDGLTQKDVRTIGGGRQSRQASRQLKTAQNVRQQLIRDLNQDFHKRSSPTKQVSPVNLRHSGGLHRSLQLFTKGGVTTNFRLVVTFRDRLADIHNRLGAGKSKVIRRLLPTNQGEQFNRKITSVLLNELRKAADLVAKQFGGQ